MGVRRKRDSRRNIHESVVAFVMTRGLTQVGQRNVVWSMRQSILWFYLLKKVNGLEQAMRVKHMDLKMCL